MLCRRQHVTVAQLLAACGVRFSCDFTACKLECVILHVLYINSRLVSVAPAAVREEQSLQGREPWLHIYSDRGQFT